LLFITGTDTGVGKTLLTSLLLSYLRRLNVPTLALKPFCSGDRADAQLLYDLQEGALTLDEINPFFFREPLAPLVAARSPSGRVGSEEVMAHIHSILDRLPRLKKPSFLLIEGVGGLLVPLGSGYFILDVIRELGCEVAIVSRNILGTLNHTLLTIGALENGGSHRGRPGFAKQGIRRKKQLQLHRPRQPKVVLMQQKRGDSSSASNPHVLAQLLAPIPVLELPFFRGNLRNPQVLEQIEKKFEKTLAQLVV
jgi:dethiobiotin synthase